MDKRITSSSIKEDHLSREALELMDDLDKRLEMQEPIIYYDFPLFQDEVEGNVRSKLLLVSRDHGVIAIECLDNVTCSGKQLEDALSRLDHLDSVLFSKIVKSRALRVGRRETCVPLRTIVLCLGRNTKQSDINHNDIIFSKEELEKALKDNESTALTDLQWSELRSIIEGGKGIFKVPERNTDAYDITKKIHALSALESEIANFDRDQRLAAITYTKGPQRIRGLAGSGKTIVLAMKVARLHLEEPDSKILFTFWTKSLYGSIRNLITRFYRQFSDSDVDWTKIDVLHGWGGRNLEGVYYNACIENGLSPYTLRDVPHSVKHGFSYICDKILNIGIRPKYDHVIIDEGQDFPPSFYQLCFFLTKGEETDRNIVWAFDELQTIMEADTQNLATTFGLTRSGEQRIDLERAAKNCSGDLLPHDIVLRKCYRNPREILLAAHALGFGIHDQIVQNLEDEEHWKVVGYNLISGRCEIGCEVVFERPVENSPLSISSHPSAGRIIEYQAFENVRHEVEHVCSEIEGFINEGIRLHDMLIVCLDDRNLGTYTRLLGESLSKKSISLNNIKASSYDVPNFFVDDQITIATVYSAKGNEAPAVFLVGIDAVHPIRHTKKGRNRLFTGVTRSKAWLRVSGVGPQAAHFCKELEMSGKQFPRLEFTWPDKSKIQTILNDVNKRSKKLLEVKQQLLDLGISELSDEELEILASTKSKD